MNYILLAIGYVIGAIAMSAMFSWVRRRRYVAIVRELAKLR